MEKFLGILFCGGRGRRLDKLTKYVSKPLLPVYDQPAFLYSLHLMKKSRYIKDIIILANEDNYKKFKEWGYRTICQDNSLVEDMFSGLKYIKRRYKTTMDYVLMPSDNVSNIDIDLTIKHFLNNSAEICFNIIDVNSEKKLKQMGCFFKNKNKLVYKPKSVKNAKGVVAPYVVQNKFPIRYKRDHVNISHAHYDYVYQGGYWFDIGDIQSYVECCHFMYKLKKG